MNELTPPHRRALLIGAPLDGLMGVEHDLDAMARVLAGRGFGVDRCFGAEATRAGVLHAYERLIAETETGDAVVVYYSGHGGLARPPEGVGGDEGAYGVDPAAAESVASEFLQFIAPVDYYDTRADDFRGITSAELSALLARLTARTVNATVILDCCHAGRMSRDSSMRTRSLPELASYEALRAHIAKLRRDGTLPAEPSRSGGNPDAVRIVACAPGESSYEYRGRAGLRIGMLTEALVEVLAELGDERIAWAALMDRVRRRVLELEPAQRPEAEGPSRRFVFEAAEDDAVSALRVTSVDGSGTGTEGGTGRARLRLECAALLGVRVGDEFAVMPSGSTEADPRAAIGQLVVDEVGPRYAEGDLGLRPGWSCVPLGARAFRTAMSVPAFPVALPTGDPRAARLVEAVEVSPSLRVAGPDERWLASVLVGTCGELTVSDRLGPLHAPRPASPEGVRAVLRDLRALAQVSALLQAAGGTDWRLGVDVSVEWGTVRRGVRHRLPGSGAAVRVGEHVYVEVRNNSAQRLFISLVDVGVSGRITVLTKDSPSGQVVASGGRLLFGAAGFDGVLIGEPLGWPDGLDPAVARWETVLVLVSATPHDVSVLEQDGVRRSGPGAGSPLARMLGRITRLDGRRIAVPEERPPGPSDGYDIHVVEFELGAEGDGTGRITSVRQ